MYVYVYIVRILPEAMILLGYRDKGMDGWLTKTDSIKYW